MPRRSKRALERAIADLVDEATDVPEPCSDCGGMPPGYDADERATAEFVTYECTCGDAGDGFDLVVSFEDGDDEADEDAPVIDFTTVDT